MEEELLDLNWFIYSLTEDFVTLYLRERYEEAIEAYTNDTEPTEENVDTVRSILIYKILSQSFRNVVAKSYVENLKLDLMKKLD